MPRLTSLCVYCGSSNAAPRMLMEAAFALGREIGRAGLRLVYGGGRVGLMGRVADGVVVEGGKVTGIIPAHLHEREIAHDAIDELLVVDSMHERKRLMAERADAFAILPGGYGTLDEFFEIVTWRQLGLHAKPILLVDHDGYWAPLVEMLDRIVERGFAREFDPPLFVTVTGFDRLLPALVGLAGSDEETRSALM